MSPSAKTAHANGTTRMLGSLSAPRPRYHPPMHAIADPLPRTSLGEEIRRFRVARARMEASGVPMFEPRSIWPGLKGIVEDPNETAHVFTLFESMIGPLEVRGIGHFLESSRGRALLDARPKLVERLSDRAWLASLPEGSLGRAYLAFVTREGISAMGLVEASHRGAVLGTGGEGDLAFVGDYLRDAHDVWHAATGYSGDVVGELSLLAFSFAQMGNLGVGLVVGLALALGPVLPTPLTRVSRRVIAKGYVRGRRANWLPTVDWIPLLPRRLEEVRRELCIDRVAPYREIRVPVGESLLDLGKKRVA